MKIDVLTISPGMFPGPLDESIVKRARESGRLQLGVRDLRDYTHDRHRTVDDRPFGGGPGMLCRSKRPSQVFAGGGPGGGDDVVDMAPLALRFRKPTM